MRRRCRTTTTISRIVDSLVNKRRLSNQAPFIFGALVARVHGNERDLTTERKSHKEWDGHSRPICLSENLTAKACPESFDSAQDKLRRRKAKGRKKEGTNHEGRANENSVTLWLNLFEKTEGRQNASLLLVFAALSALG